jgi:hypothetical protein
MRVVRSLAVACIVGLVVVAAAAPAGAGRQTTTPVSITVHGVAGSTDVVSDGGAYAGTLSSGTLTMRLPAGRGLTVYVGGQELKCAPEPYWSRLQVLNVNAAGRADARLDCTTTASGLADGTAGTPWVIDYPPYKYGTKGDPGPCVAVAGNSYSTATGCAAKAYRGPSGYQRGAEVYRGPVSFSLTTS